jgi:putative sterol carrier protein
VPRFLTPSWVEEFNAALDGVVVPVPGPDSGLAAQDGRFTVAQEVRGTPDGDVRLILHVDDGSLHLSLTALDGTGSGNTEGPEPTVTVALAYEDAAAMAKGELAPADALTTGRVRVRGDLSVLVAGQQMLAAARAGTQTLRSSTTY